MKIPLKFRNNNLYRLLVTVICVTLTFFIKQSLLGQTEMTAWGNIDGIRVEGELMEFSTSLCVIDKGWNIVYQSAKEKQQPKYHRKGNIQTVNTKLGAFQVSESVQENDRGSALLAINAMAASDTPDSNIFLCIELPGKFYKNAEALFSKSSGSNVKVKFTDITDGNHTNPIKTRADGFTVESQKRKIAVDFDTAACVYIRKTVNDADIQLYISLSELNPVKGGQVKRNFTFHADGIIDTTAVDIAIDCKNPGSVFEGFGGNFRLQNPELDSKVIQYCLDNMRVAWGRVEMPWQFWHPDENIDPVAYAESGKMHEHVRASMELAQKLTRLQIPVVISCWFAPEWAIIGELSDAYKYRYKGIYGYPLNTEKTKAIYESIASYLVYLKQNYGVEPAFFSFNESDLGIDIRHTGKEHAEFIKGIGAVFASKGITTKLSLGDNSDATTFDFILPAVNDPETHKFIGAISFHSWRGCDDATLEKWAGAAKKLNVPLIVGEGSTDAAAWSYPDVFYEPTFALYEINLYTRLCSICQPKTILQWQLTSDYSLLAGNGINKTQGPLTPTQRFWNLKQLASTPKGAFAIPVQCSKENVNCAAFGNIAKGEYAVHIVNNGAKCRATLKGLPLNIKRMEIFVTNPDKNMESAGVADVIDGSVTFVLEAAGFTTLISE